MGKKGRDELKSKPVSGVLSQEIGAPVLARIGLAFLPTAEFARVK